MAMAMAITSVEKSFSKSIIGGSRRPPSARASVPAISSLKQGKSSRRFPSLCSGKPEKGMAMAAVVEKAAVVTDVGSTVSSEQSAGRRPLANFPPSIWGSSFASLSVSSSELESYSRKVAELKEKVEEMLQAASAKHPLQTIEFIDHLERLGVSYHFEAEIEEQLSLVFDSLPRVFDHLLDYDDLYSAALLFRVLRQNGYKVPCDLFDKFKDANGKTFKEALKSDVRGILSLYEASHVNLPGEDILDEALAFARATLEEYLEYSSPGHDDHLVEHIKNALIWPFHRSSRPIEALKYMSFYAQCSCKNETLLNFAKVDFNYVQLLHRQELATVTRWWKETNLTEELGYARDRIAELYFWGMGARFEPQFSASRIAAVKYTKLISLVDDTYDAYGTPSELQLFTDAVNRCDTSTDIGLLPDYMKVLYRGLMNLLNETEADMEKSGRGYIAHHAKQEFKGLVRAFHVEAKWFHEGYIPTLSEYMENGLASSSYGVITTAFFIGAEKLAGIKEYQWLQTNPTIHRALKLLGRLLDDIASHKDEQKRGHCASAVECCMEEQGLTEEEAVAEVKRICEDLWKEMNQETMRPTAVGMPVIRYFVDLVRMVSFVYHHKDTYTNPISMKDHIKRFLLDPLPLDPSLIQFINLSSSSSSSLSPSSCAN